MADGSEFTGQYQNVPKANLSSFLLPNIEILSKQEGVDALLFETFPLLSEALVAAETSRQVVPELPIIISFSCKDGASLSSGEPFSEAVQALNRFSNVRLLSASLRFRSFLAPT